MDLRRSILQSAPSPLLLVQSSAAAELLALKNGLTVTDLLRPFASISGSSFPIRTPQRSFTISELSCRLLPASELACTPVEYSDPALSAALDATTLDGSAGSILGAAGQLRSKQDGVATAWFTALRRELSRSGLRSLPFELSDAPVGVFIVVSTADSNPAAVARELASTAAAPWAMSPATEQFGVYGAGSASGGGPAFASSSGSIAPGDGGAGVGELPRFVLLLHDVGAAAAGGLHVLRRAPAGAGGTPGSSEPELLPLADPAVAVRELRASFPPACVSLVPINSLGTAAALAVTQPDLWESAMPKAPLLATTVQRIIAAQYRAVVPGVDLAASPSSSSSFAELLLSRAAVPVRGCCLSGEDVLALRSTLSRLLGEQLLPSLEARIFALHSAIAAAKKASGMASGLRDTLRSWWGGGGGPAPGAAGAGAGVGPGASGSGTPTPGYGGPGTAGVGMGAGMGMGGASPMPLSGSGAGAGAGTPLTPTPGAGVGGTGRVGVLVFPPVLPAALVLRGASAAGAAEAAAAGLAASSPAALAASFPAVPAPAGCDAACVSFPSGSMEAHMRALGDVCLQLGDWEGAASAFRRLREELGGGSAAASGNGGPAAGSKGDRSPCFFAAACEAQAIALLCGLCAGALAAGAAIVPAPAGAGAAPGSAAAVLREAEGALEAAHVSYFRAAAAAGAAPLPLPAAVAAAGAAAGWRPQSNPVRRLAVRCATRVALLAADAFCLGALPPAGLFAVASGRDALAAGSARCRDAAALLRRSATAEMQVAAGGAGAGAAGDGSSSSRDGASGSSVLPAALLEAAGNLLTHLQPTPSLRKAAHHYAQAGQAYSSAGMHKLAVRCLALALSEYWSEKPLLASADTPAPAAAGGAGAGGKGGASVGKAAGALGKGSAAPSSTASDASKDSSGASSEWAGVADQLLLSLAQALVAAGDLAAGARVFAACLGLQAAASAACSGSSPAPLPLLPLHLPPLGMPQGSAAAIAGAASAAASLSSTVSPSSASASPSAYGFSPRGLQLRLPPSMHRSLLREWLRCETAATAATAAAAAASGIPAANSLPGGLPRVILSALSVASFSNAAAAEFALRCIAAWQAAEGPRARAACAALLRGLPASAAATAAADETDSASGSATAFPLSLAVLAEAAGTGCALVSVHLPARFAGSSAAASPADDTAASAKLSLPLPLPLPVPVIAGEGPWLGAACGEGPSPTAPLLGCGWGLHGIPSAAALASVAKAAERLAAAGGLPIGANAAAALQRDLQALLDASPAEVVSSAPSAAAAAALAGAPVDSATLLSELLTNVAMGDGGAPFPSFARAPVGAHVFEQRQAAWSAVEAAVPSLVSALDKLASAAAARAVAAAAAAQAPALPASTTSDGTAVPFIPDLSGLDVPRVAAALSSWLLSLFAVDAQGSELSLRSPLTVPDAADPSTTAGAASGTDATTAVATAAVASLARQFPRINWHALCRLAAIEQADEEEARAARHASMPATHTRVHAAPLPAPSRLHHEHAAHTPQASVAGGGGGSRAHVSDSSGSGPYTGILANLAAAGPGDGLAPALAPSALGSASAPASASACPWDWDGDCADSGEAAYAGAPVTASGARPTAASSFAGAGAGAIPGMSSSSSSSSFSPLAVLGLHFHSRDATAKPCSRPAGEPIIVSLLLHNPLAVPLPLMGTHVAPVVTSGAASVAAGGASESVSSAVAVPFPALPWRLLDDHGGSLGPGSHVAGAVAVAAAAAAAAAVLPIDVLLSPGETRNVRLAVVPLRPGAKLNACRLNFRLGGALACSLPLELAGPPLPPPAATRSPDNRLLWNVAPPAPLAELTIRWDKHTRASDLHDDGSSLASTTLDLLDGEVVCGTLAVRNASAAPASPLGSGLLASGGALSVSQLQSALAIDTLVLNVAGKGAITLLPLAADGKGSGSDAYSAGEPLPSLGLRGDCFVLPLPSHSDAAGVRVLLPGETARWRVLLRACGAGERTLRCSLLYGCTGLGLASSASAASAAAASDAASSCSVAPEGGASTGTVSAAAVPSSSSPAPQSIAAARRAAAAAMSAATSALLQASQAAHPLLSPRRIATGALGAGAGAGCRFARWVSKVRVRPGLVATAQCSPSASAAGEWNLVVRIAHAAPPRWSSLSQPRAASALAAASAAGGASAAAVDEIAASEVASAAIAVSSVDVLSDYFAARMEGQEAAWQPQPQPHTSAAASAGAAAGTTTPVAEAASSASAAAALGASGAVTVVSFREVRALRFRLLPRRAPPTVLVDAASGERGELPAGAEAETSADGVADGSCATSEPSLALFLSTGRLSPAAVALLRQHRARLKVAQVIAGERASEQEARRAAAAAEALPPSIRAVAERTAQRAQVAAAGGNTATSGALAGDGGDGGAGTADGLLAPLPLQMPLAQLHHYGDETKDAHAASLAYALPPHEAALPCSAAALRGGSGHVHMTVSWVSGSRRGQLHLIGVGVPGSGAGQGTPAASASGATSASASSSIVSSARLPHALGIPTSAIATPAVSLRFAEPSLSAWAGAGSGEAGGSIPNVLVSVHAPHTVDLRPRAGSSDHHDDGQSEAVVSVAVIVFNASATAHAYVRAHFDPILPPVPMPAPAQPVPAAPLTAGGSGAELPPSAASATSVGAGLRVVAPAVWVGPAAVDVGVLPPGGRAVVMQRVAVSSRADARTVLSLSQAVRVQAASGSTDAPSFLFAPRASVFLRLSSTPSNG